MISSELAPTGALRGGVVAAPAASAFFAIRNGVEVKGVTVDLIRSFAVALKLPLSLQVYDNSGQVTDAVAKGDCDLAFMRRMLNEQSGLISVPPIISLRARTSCLRAPPLKRSKRSIGQAAELSLYRTRRQREARAEPLPMRALKKSQASTA